jgi:DNA-directed RNA polymerase subunit N (RpoN/RPB10)|tara:strand:+ start:141 stop:374 length:234 start_codon:yes stop_codon:yes gene_type:complete
MIIPIKCFTCGKVLADKYLFYQKEVRKLKIEQNIEQNRVSYLDENNCKKTPEGTVLDNIKLTKICCRRHMLTHVDIE